jgi:hypothetical protein
MPTVPSSTRISGAAPAPSGSDRRGQWSETRAAAVVEAAYILQTVRR